MDDTIRHPGQGAVVRDDEYGLARLPAGVLQQLQHRLAGLVVQRTGRLVAEDHLGVLCQCAGDGNALLLAARKLGREVIHAVGKPQFCQHFLRRKAPAADFRRQLHILPRRQVLHQIIELENESDIVPAVLGERPPAETGDLPPVQPDVTGCGGIHAAQNVQKGGLARAAVPHDDAQLALLHGKAHVVQRACCGWIELAYAVKFNVCHVSVLPPSVCGGRVTPSARR